MRPLRLGSAGPSLTQKPMRAQASSGRVMTTGAVFSVHGLASSAM